MRGRVLLLAGLLPFPGAALGQKPLQQVTGTVRDTANRPLAGVEVLIGPRRTTTGPQGLFRVDSLPPGVHPVTVRLVGYRPVRSRLPVLAAEPTEVDYYLAPDPYRLPTLEVAASRGGIYGTVGDIGLKPLAGVRVDVFGYRGGTAFTDSLGRFAFPVANQGLYVVRVMGPGFAERRITVEVPKGKGRELGFQLGSAPERRLSRIGEAALFDLGRRLAFGFRRERMSGSEFARYGSLSLCEVPRIRTALGRQQNALLNGETQLLPGQVCSWRTDEVGLVELTGGSMRRTGRRLIPGPSYVIIWEKW